VIQTSKRKTRQQTKKKQGGANLFAKSFSRSENAKYFKNSRTLQKPDSVKAHSYEQYPFIIKHAIYNITVSPNQIESVIPIINEIEEGDKKVEEIKSKNAGLRGTLTKTINKLKNLVTFQAKPILKISDEVNQKPDSSIKSSSSRSVEFTKIFEGLPKNAIKLKTEFAPERRLRIYDAKSKNNTSVTLSKVKYIQKESTPNKIDCINKYFTVVLLFYSPASNDGSPDSNDGSPDSNDGSITDYICVLRIFIEENFINMNQNVDDYIKKRDVFYDYKIDPEKKINIDHEIKNITQNTITKLNDPQYTTILDEDKAITDLHLIYEDYPISK
jgi:hypothetical protein